MTRERLRKLRREDPIAYLGNLAFRSFYAFVANTLKVVYFLCVITGLRFMWRMWQVLRSKNAS